MMLPRCWSSNGTREHTREGCPCHAKAMKSAGSMINKLPEEVRPLIKRDANFSYKGNGLEFMYLYTEYTPEVGRLDLEGGCKRGD